MRPRTLYLSLCILGTVLPYTQFAPFLSEHGLDLRLVWAQLLSNRVGGFFGLDVFVSSIVLWAFVFIEGRRGHVPHLWVPIAASLTVGVSLGLPLFLCLREIQFERRTPGAHVQD